MFYSQFILAKKGPLGTIWIAAHLERKLRKNQVADTDIGVSVDSILFPEMPIALRLSSHLLLGVVRIYSKKVNYLFDDCSEALLKVKQAFRSTAVDLPPEESTAPYHSITLPETFDLDDFELPDNDLQGNYVDQHISSKDQITLQDTMEGVVYTTSKFGLDERFGDGDTSGLDLDEELLVEKAATPELATGASNSDDDPQASVDANASGVLNEDLDEYDGDNEPIDYAEGPCTPGLWEEPNLSNIQETSACDDHQEPENHAITESAVKENLENVFSHQHHNQLELPAKSPRHAAETEQMLTRDLDTALITRSPSTATVIPVSSDPPKREDLLNKNARDEGPGFQTANYNHENFVQYQGNQDPGVQSGNDSIANFVGYQGIQGNTFHLTSELESNTGKDNLVGPPPYHTSLEPKDASTPILYPHDSMPNSNLPSLRPCITFMNHETDAEGSHASEVLNRSFPETHHAEIDQNHQVRADNVIQREVQVESINNYTSDFSATVTQREVQVENVNSYANDYPAPEKRLSLPHWLSDVPKNFVSESTPIEKVIASGKKRSFTESSMSDHSLNLNESSGLVNTNTTSQSFNLNASSGFYSTNTTAQSPNLNQSSGFFSTNTTAQSPNLNQSSGFFTTNKTAQSPNLNQSAGFFTTNTTAQSPNLNQSAGFFTTNTTAQSSNLNQSSGFFTTNTIAQSPNLIQSSGFLTTNTIAQSPNLNQSSGLLTTNTIDQSPNLNQSSGLLTTNSTAQSLNLNQSSGLLTTNSTAQSLNLNQSSGFYTTSTTAQSRNLNQSSGFFTTNTTSQSLNLNQSSGQFTIDMSGKSVVNDADMLSSILVGRKSSILKTKPSPPIVTPSTKRRRSTAPTAPKTGVPKRKALMDDNMVLHGDTIRQQLTNTEDIRRLRKKAPCTRSEISMLEKQLWEDEIFSEPIFTGVSIKLASLHSQLYNLSKIVVSRVDASLEGGKDQKSISQSDEKDKQLETEPNVPKENANFEPAAQRIEVAAVTDNHTHDKNTVGLDYYGSQPPQVAATEHVAEPINSEHDLFGERTAMEIDQKTFPDTVDIEVSVMPTEVEQPIHADVEPPTHADVVPSDAFDMSTAMSEIQVDASLQTDAAGVNSTEKADLQSADGEIVSFKALESNLASETNIDVAPLKEVSEEKHDQDIEFRKNEETNIDVAPVEEVSEEKHDQAIEFRKIEETNIDVAPVKEVSEEKHDQAIEFRKNEETNIDVAPIKKVSEEKHDQDIEFRKNEEESVNEDAALASNVESNIQKSVYNGIFGEEFGTVAAYDTEVNPVLENASLDQRDNQGHHVTFETTEMNVEDIPASNLADNVEIAHPALENNTDFLNFDDLDDDVADAGGDYAADVEATRVIDNTGWSSRTKAVAKYLQIMFDKEDERGRNMLSVNNLLVGKTRKEASRMFFETLVLKTKDYIHVEQPDPFQNINIFPRSKLLKSDF